MRVILVSLVVRDGSVSPAFDMSRPESQAQEMVVPLSAIRIDPVVMRDSSEARVQRGVRDIDRLADAEQLALRDPCDRLVAPIILRARSVRVVAGAMALTRTFCGA